MSRETNVEAKHLYAALRACGLEEVAKLAKRYADLDTLKELDELGHLPIRGPAFRRDAAQLRRKLRRKV